MWISLVVLLGEEAVCKSSQISQCGASDAIMQSQRLMYKVMDSHNPRAPRAPSGVMLERQR